MIWQHSPAGALFIWHSCKLQGGSSRSEELESRNAILNSDSPAKKIQKKYIKKLEYRCEDMLSRVFKGCYDIFEKAYKKCYDNLHRYVNWICKSMKVSFVCNFFSLFGGNLCTANNIVDPNMGSLYDSLNSSRETLKRDFLNQHFHYKVIDVPPEAKQTAKDIYEASRNIIDEFKSKKSLVDVLMTIIMRCTAFSFVFIIIGCNNYLFNYLNDIEADNRYVTMYFRKIDYRRYTQGKFTLLPLKANEKVEISDVYEVKLNQEEKGELTHALISTITLFFFSFLFITIDQLLYTLLADLREYGAIAYTQVGHHDVELNIKGVGFLSSMLRSIVNSFTVKRRIKRVVTNEECLPIPNTPGAYNFKIFGSFLLLIILALLNACVFKRLNRYVCGVFFPKAEKKRIIHLYNEYLKKRVTFLNFRLDILKRDSGKPKPDELTFARVLRIKHGRLFNWLKYFRSTRRKCWICQEYEPKSGGEFHCTHINCYAYFCDQCWYFVVKQKCIGCPKYKEETTPPVEN